MSTKYQPLKHNDGRMLAVVWPEKRFKDCTEFQPEEGRQSCPSQFKAEGACYCENYYQQCREAIANGIEFKDQEDIELLERHIRLNILDRPDLKMEKMKPYDLPEGIKLEFKKLCKHCLSDEIEAIECNGAPCQWILETDGKLFAFIKKQQPIRLGIPSSVFKENLDSIIGQMKQQSERKEETQDELWNEVMELTRSNWPSWPEVKSKFRIERIK